MTSPQGQDSGAPRSRTLGRITAYETTTGKYIFTEDGNGEAWIVTDQVIEPEP